MLELKASMSEWEQITLGDLLNRVRRKVAVEDGVAYPAVSVQAYGRGLGDKEPFVGGVSKYTTLNTVRENDVVLRTITAFEAPAGVARAEHDGTHVSGVFITYKVDQEALPEFLGLYFQTPAFWDEMQNRASGTVLRRKTISDASFRDIPFALPPLPIQERIVEVIGAVDDQITALDAEAGAVEAVYRAATSLLWCTAEGQEAEFRVLGDVMHLDVARIPMEAGTSYHLAGVLNAGKGLVDKGVFDGADTEYSAMNVLRENQVVMRKLTAWEGPITVVPAEFDGFVASNEFPTFTLGGDVAPGWMKHVCRTPRLWAEMQSRVVGTVQRRKRLNPDQLLSLALPVPSRPEQEQVAEVLDVMEGQVDAIRAEANRLRKVRAGLLSSLLNRNIEIESELEG
jgi:type I restriction enzyme S subunit